MPERQDVRAWLQVPRLQDELRMAVHPTVPLVVLLALRAEWVWEPVLAQRAWPQSARSQPREPELWAQLLARWAPQPGQLARPSRALRVQGASPRAWQVPPGRLVLQPQEQHLLVEVLQRPQASFVQPLPRHPSLLFLPWPQLPPAPPLRRRLESACALSPRRPPESNSSASSFP